MSFQYPWLLRNKFVSSMPAWGATLTRSNPQRSLCLKRSSCSTWKLITRICYTQLKRRVKSQRTRMPSWRTLSSRFWRDLHHKSKHYLDIVTVGMYSSALSPVIMCEWLALSFVMWRCVLKFVQKKEKVSISYGPKLKIRI